MPRPRIDLSTVQEEITGLHRDGSSINTIRTHLLEHHQLQTGDFFVKHDDFMLKRLRDEGLRSQSSVLKEFGLKRGSTAANPLKRSKSQENAPEYRDFTPENVRERWGRTRYTRRDFSIHGPDWVWSIDGYDKLKNWGFEIYAGIDAYSRYITWFYCGFSSGTSWNVAKQYLHVLNQRHAMPRILRSDHGNETSLLCGIHYYLSGMRTKEQGSDLVPIAFGDCWYFGRSIHNTRIESWWHRLGSNRAGFWRLKGGSIILFDISQIVHTFEAGNLRSYIISLILLVNRIMPRRSHPIGFAYAPSFSMRIPRT
ncbi:hypothetical protein HRG_012300 [Hirsutella rhossiliensis]